MKINEIYEAKVTGVNNFGNGICRIPSANDGRESTVFVPHTYGGDVIKLKITDVTSSLILGAAIEFVEKSSNRNESDCPVFSVCGGCDFRDITYAHELEMKKSFVISALRRNGFSRDSAIDVAGIVSSGEVCGYRSKLIVRTNVYGRGYYKKSSYDTAHHTRCLLHPPNLDEIAGEAHRILADFGVSMYDEKTDSGTLRGLYIREARSTGDVMLCTILRNEKVPCLPAFASEITAEFPDIKSVFANLNDRRTNVALGNNFMKIHGTDYIEDIICGLRFRISPQSFYQVNHGAAEILYGLALDAIEQNADSPKVIADLYCGTGTMGIMCAKRFPAARVVGVEIVEDAVADAVYNAKLNGLANVEFVCGDAEEFREDADVVIIDPPRKGCSPGMIGKLLELSPERIVYISCNPETMARDARRLCEDGYRVTSVVPVDLFPRTVHVETVVLLSKLKSTTSIEVKIDLDEVDLTKSESKATYDEIKAYVLEQTGLKVSQFYVAQVKRKHGIIERENYNTGDGKAKTPQVPLEKEKAIEIALRYFQMI